MLIGLLACLGACLLLGTLFVPIKACPPTDGFATQLFMCLAGYIVSFAIYVYMEFPGIYSLAMVGGAVWSATNSFAVPIMTHVGMAMFMLFASSISCLTGWAISRFGLFGVPPSLPMSNILNYSGIALLILGSAIYPFIKINVFRAVKVIDPHVKVVPMNQLEMEERQQHAEKEDVDMNDSVRKVAAWIGTILVGLSLGVMTTPVTLLMTRHDIYPLSTEIKSSVSFHFSFFTGVILVSIVIFVFYCLVKKGKPAIPPRIVLPSMLSGVFFSSAMAFFFIANEHLSPTISYPICMMAPGLVTSAWSVFYFKEISERRNLLLLGVAYIFTLIGVLVITVSRIVQF
ncbi:hypothetical protein GCK72_017430 [Caenorhabditis remanei]|uniref:Transmembrane protein 144 n=1 Tax=Caenorhabditis remanei TaxID=31234 RepID=A0A6A5G8M8_CAERE|nr:hypothetical protein GCK72_017430 [Caenorhabditis remanei]KAF1750879.1 hypothetical protein GCK72_017430 [Caenorhabditis remanei]